MINLAPFHVINANAATYHPIISTDYELSNIAVSYVKMSETFF